MLTLITVALGALFTAKSPGPEAFLTFPDIHGDQVVFSAEGDLWMADVKTGDSRRLTSDPGVESRARFSPDGSQIAFTASYDGAPNVYVMPTTGGTPKRLTYDPTVAQVVGWMPDGQSVLFRSPSKLLAPGFERNVTTELFSVQVTGGIPTKLPVPRVAFASMNRDGHTLAYVPTSNEWMNWFRYEGGEADKIWIADTSTGTFTKVTNSKGVDTQPLWVGNSVYFVSERSGVRNLWQLDPATKKVKAATTITDGPVRNPSGDGKRIVFEAGPNIEVFDPATGATTDVPIHLNSDHIHSRPFDLMIEDGPRDGVGIGPAGKRVAIAVRGHLVTVPVGEGPMRSVAGDSHQRIQNPVWSADGKQIAYVSDASGEEQIYTVGANDGTTPKQLTKDLAGEHGGMVWSPDGKYILIGDRDNSVLLVEVATGLVKRIAKNLSPTSYDAIQTDFAFSRDSKWVAFSAGLDASILQVSLYSIASGVTTPVTDPTIDSSSPAFTPDGKYLVVTQNRNVAQSFTSGGRIAHTLTAKLTGFALAADTASPFLPKDDEEAEAAKKPEEPSKETKVDLEGLQDRYFDMKAPAGDYNGMFAVPGKLIIQADRNVVAFDIATKTMTTLATGATLIELSQDGKKLLIQGNSGLQVIDPSGGPASPSGGVVKLAGLSVSVDPVAEWKQIFAETWRCGRDFFYDPNFHGVNWNAVKAKYEARLPMVATRDDLNRVLSDMVSEFNTGHCYINGPSAFSRKAARSGMLGADFEWDAAASAYKIKHILRGETWSPEDRSPLAEPGLNVHEGDYLLKIGGRDLSKNTSPEELLLGTAGLTTSITVNSTGSPIGARTVSVVPIAQENSLRSQEWINSRKVYVEKASGGQIGYVYVSNMSAVGSNQFAKYYYPNTRKPGIIVDVRGNGGGSISGNLLNDLASKVTGYFSFRSGGNYWREGWAPLGQVVALTNEYAFSDGEYFSEFFKRLKIGPLVGHRTGGGEVGSGGGYRMMDGGAVYIPNYGAWIPGQWVIEGKGAIPDFEVEQDPASVMAGKDPQLDKAIAIIMEGLREHPFVRPQHPPFPVKLGGSQGG